MLRALIASGLEQLGTRYPPEHAAAADTCLQEKPIEAFRRFHADTATFGSKLAVEAGTAFFCEDRMVFASDFPFAGIEGSLEASSAIPAETLLANTLRILNRSIA